MRVLLHVRCCILLVEAMTAVIGTGPCAISLDELINFDCAALYQRQTAGDVGGRVASGLPWWPLASLDSQGRLGSLIISGIIIISAASFFLRSKL